MTAAAGTIVVGIDGSKDSDAALVWAVEQAVAEKRALTLVHTVHAATQASVDAAVAYSVGAAAAMQTEARRVLDEARTQVEWLAPDLQVHEVLQLADPRQVLLDLSGTAAMVVVGSRGHGPLASLVMGSVGVALVRHAECPVVVHRPGTPGWTRHGIVVAADAHAESQPVIEFAYFEAELRGLPLTVLHCAWDVAGGTMASALVPETDDHLQDAERGMAEVLAGMGEKYPDVVATTQVVRGLPHEVILRCAESMNLVVVGSHQKTLPARLLLGSVSLSVVEHATGPVAVVPVSAQA